MQLTRVPIAYCWWHSKSLSETLRSICRAFRSDGYFRFSYDVLYHVRPCLEVYIPLAFLVIGNALIVVKVMQRSARLNQTNSQSAKTTSMTVTLVAESVLFVLLNVPNEILSIPTKWRNLQKELSSLSYYITLLVSVLLVYIGSSVNFAMYMLIGGKFRAAFRETFGGLRGYIRDRVSSAWQIVSTRIWTTEHVKSRPERDAELPLGVMTLCPERDSELPLGVMTSRPERLTELPLIVMKSCAETDTEWPLGVTTLQTTPVYTTKPKIEYVFTNTFSLSFQN